MKTKIIILLILAGISSITGSYLLSKQLHSKPKPSTLGITQTIQTPKPTPEPPPIPLEQKILAEMTIEEKVGQLFIFGIEGNTTIEPQNKQFLIDTKPGGIILFSKNITDENQIKNLITEIQSTNPHIPLFISIDQEGGVVSRLNWNDTLTKSQESIQTKEQAYEVAKNRGEILRNLGINMNLAPVAEINENIHSFMYKRTYRGNSEDIVEKIVSSVRGYKDAGVLPVLKHFPGHGESNTDPHNTLPKVSITGEQWITYVEPFRRVVEEERIDAIMIGHILLPNIAPDPATISKEIITDRLKNEIGYEGLIISDDMEMGALKNIDTPENLAKRSTLAGVDIQIYVKYSSDNKYSQRIAYNTLLEEVKEGRLDIDRQVLKILRVKMGYGVLNLEDYSEDIDRRF